MSRPILASQIVSQSFDWKTVSSARALCRQGAVLDWGFDIAQTKIIGRVQEQSDHHPYKVEVLLSGTADCQDYCLSGKCTCPLERDCVHVAAVAIIAAEALPAWPAPELSILLFEESERPPVDAGEPYPAAAAWWLKRLAAKVSGESIEQTLEECLVYSFDVEARFGAPHLQIEPRVARKLKAGGFGASRPYNWQQIGESRARFVQEIDRSIAKLWVACTSRDIQIVAGKPLLPPDDPGVLDLLLHRIIGTNRGYWQLNFSQPLRLGAERGGKIEWLVHEDARQSPQVVLEEPHAALKVLYGSSNWYIDLSNNEAGPVRLPFSNDIVQTLCAAPRVSPKDAEAVHHALRRINARLPAPQAEVAEEIRTERPIPCLHLKFEKLQHRFMVSTDRADKGEYRDGTNVAILSFDYGFDPKKLAQQSQDWESYRWIDGNKAVVTKRDAAFERAVCDRLANLRFSRFGYLRLPPTQSCWVARKHDRESWSHFVQETLPSLRLEGWQCTVDSSFEIQVVEASDDWFAQVDESQGFWFSLDLGILVDGQRVPLLPILTETLRASPLIASSLSSIERLNRHGKFYAPLPDGRLVALPFERVRDILSCLVELLDKNSLLSGERLNISISQMMSLFDSSVATNLNWQVAGSLQSLIGQMRNFDWQQEVSEPERLRTSLRPYQKTGLRWLEFIATFKLGGILADDMGLGKTVQTLAHIERERQAGSLSGPILVVCPTSVVSNWSSEANRLIPELKVVSLRGADRASRFMTAQTADIVVTTYPLLVRDLAQLMSIRWHAVILDEAQAIKNYDTKAAQAVQQLDSSYRLCLTGTPIENHLGELWSQFNFLMPGLLGDKRTFDRIFKIPIEDEGDQERLNLLIARIKPFILRRTKDEVAKDLPGKTEIIKHIELEGQQRDLYETVRLSMHQEVLAEVKRKGWASCQLIILDALMKMRQVCCHPSLVKLPAARGVSQSAKFEYLMTMIGELVEENRRILLFSQFTSMLDLIAAELKAQGISFVELRGDTRDRDTPIRQFQSGQVHLFLISLKAGGTAANLTAADTVIHYDPWWNPAVEDQATDRAHRIGQKNSVFVYRLIATGTIEQRMLELQEQKRRLSKSLLGKPDASDETPLHFAEADLAALFAPLPNVDQNATAAGA